MIRRAFVRLAALPLKLWAVALLHADPRKPKAHWERHGTEWEYGTDAMVLARARASYPDFIAEEVSDGKAQLIVRADSLHEIKKRVERHYRKYAIPG